MSTRFLGMVALVLSMVFGSAAYGASAPQTNSTHAQEAYGYLQVTPRAHEKYLEYTKKIGPLHDQLMAKTMELESITRMGATTREDVKQLIAEVVALRKQLRQEYHSFTAELVDEGVPLYPGYHEMYNNGMTHMGMMPYPHPMMCGCRNGTNK